MRTRLGQWLARWGPAIGFMLLIFLGSAQPKDGGVIPDFGIWDFSIKKSAHLTEYAILAIFMLRGLRGRKQGTGGRLLWLWAILLATLYAISDEYHQTFVEGRAGNWHDVIIDAMGASMGLIVRKTLSGSGFYDVSGKKN